MLALCAGLGTLAACTRSEATGPTTGPFRLVAFDTCDDALQGLRTAAKASVGPYGFSGGGLAVKGVPVPQAAAPLPAEDAGRAATSNEANPPGYSGTNTNEAGVDEPDLVKTDGRRIVVVHNGVLRVVDVASRTVTGSVAITDPLVPDDSARYAPADLLLDGDHALVLLSSGYPLRYGVAVPVPEQVAPALPPDAGSGSGVPGSAGGSLPGSAGSGANTPDAVDLPTRAPVPVDPTLSPLPQPILGPRLVLVDLAGSPRVLSRLSVDGRLVDARQVGSTVRVVITSTPRFSFPDVPGATEAKRLQVNRSIIDQAGVEQWVPRLEVRTGGATAHPTIGCDAIARPDVYSGANLLTVLSLDIAGENLADPAPLTLVADGDTVYSNGPSLYVATDQRWRIAVALPNGGAVPVAQGTTTVYKFDTSGKGRPRYVAGGAVPGYLINQYAMSERGGDLRVATTRDSVRTGDGTATTSQSGIYVLRPDDGTLTPVGKVEGLGKGERIYAVRFVDSTAYVVTFRQVDPLYTVDLSNPARPTVRGALKITGYSSYLHPIAGSRLIGIGQDASAEGRIAGTQVSLFDVSDLDQPTRLASYRLPGSNSSAEFDPHAFLYWPPTGLLVVPLQSYVERPVGPTDTIFGPTQGALVLRVQGDHINRIGTISHPAAPSSFGYSAPIQRSLIIGDTLWTVSDGGLMATDPASLDQLAWIALR